MENPPDLQLQIGIVAPGNLEDSGAAQEGHVSSRYGGGLPAHHREPALPPPAYYPRRHGHGDGTRLPHRGPRQVGDALNIFLFPDLSPFSGLEAALLTRKWDDILGGRNFTYFTDTSLIMGKQKVAPIAGWDQAASQLEAWTVFCTVFLGDDGLHPVDMHLLG